MDKEKLVEAVRTFDCLWILQSQLLEQVAKFTLLRTQSEYGLHPHTFQPLLLFRLLCSASSSSSCSSSSVPFSITVCVGEGGASREYCLLWIDVWHAVRKNAVL